MDGSRAQALASARRVAAAQRARDGSAGYRPAVDRLLHLAAQLVGADMLVASLVTGDSQLVVGAIGVFGTEGTLRADGAAEPEGAEGAEGAGEHPGAEPEIPLARSVCREVVVTGLPLIVRDAAGVARFAATEPVRTQGVRAYAGFPVVDADGLVVGVLAAALRRPHDWTARQLTALDNAAQVFAELLGCACASRDRDQVALQQQRAFLDALLDSLDTGVAACDAAGRLVLVNAALRRFSIGPDADVGGDLPQDWVDRWRIRHPDDGRPFEVQDMPLMRALQGETVRNVDQLLDDYRGQTRQYTCNATPIRDATGASLGAVVAVHDVTDQRRAERFRRCELAVARAMVHTADLPSIGHAVLTAVAETLGWPYAELWLHDRETRVMRPVASWHRDGFTPVPPLPAQLPEGAGLAGAAWAARQPVWVADVAASGLLSHSTADGTTLRAAVVVPIRSADAVYGALTLCSADGEEPSDALSVMLAGTAAQLGQHLQQREAQDLALQLARSKDEYIRLVGHELRTPLTSIAAYSELLTDFGDSLPDDARDLLAAVTRNSDRLRRTVDALLDLAALDSGHATIHPVTFDLSAAVREAVEVAKTIDWPVTFRVDVPDVLQIDADEERIRAAVGALLSNAVIYSHPGGTVGVALTACGDEAALTIADAGVGIPADELPFVFERFQRSSRARDLGIAGAGLGLATTRLVVQRHHGTITLRPTPGGGTTADVRLPVRQPDRLPLDAGPCLSAGGAES